MLGHDKIFWWLCFSALHIYLAAVGLLMWLAGSVFGP